MVGVRTAVPGRSRKARNDSSMAAVHELTATVCAAPTVVHSSFSNISAWVPVVSHPLESTSATYWRASSLTWANAKGTLFPTEIGTTWALIGRPAYRSVSAARAGGRVSRNSSGRSLSPPRRRGRQGDPPPVDGRVLYLPPCRVPLRP